ncbi:MAG: PfkB family carbohydrate kinase [Candidatus Omnitrophota bacterium]|nr:PfkB family carbohydrate kinase [Candidatus Omnitrophota bacterium]
MSILVLGTVALDTVKTPYGARKDMLGGSASHFSMSGRLFTDVHLASAIGRDFPREYLGFLKKKGVILNSLIQSENKTFKWKGEYKGDLSSAQTLNTELGVLLDFRPEVCKEEQKIGYVFLANIDPDLQNHLLQQMRSPRLVALDSMNYWISCKREALLKLLKKVDIYTANDWEARELSGKANLVSAAKYLLSLGPKMILIKKGEHGVLAYSSKFIFSLPAYPTDKVIDPTGAGDTFAGAFMGYLAKVKLMNEKNIKKAIAYGTIAASFNIEGFGLERSSRLTINDLENRLAKFRQCVLFCNSSAFRSKSGCHSRPRFHGGKLQREGLERV